ncbi:MAG: Ig-like domain-containing protein, partial [Chitinophagales bacterium]
FMGSDVIEVIACSLDEPAVCDTAYVDVTVMPTVDACESLQTGNEPPVAVDDSASTTDGNAVNIDVTANDSDPDGDPFTITGFTQPANGMVEMIGSELVYTPNSVNFDGTDTFTYQICDEEGGCTEATVTVEVTAINCSEVVTYCAMPVSPIEVCPVFCDLLDADNIVITSAHTTFNCSLEILDNGCIQYTALPAFAGADTIEVIGVSALGVVDTAYIAINVTDDCDAVEGMETNTEDTDIETIGKQDDEKTQEELLEESLRLASIVPVPAQDFINVSFEAGNEEVGVTIYDLTGKPLGTQNFDAQNGMNVVRLDVSTYPTGVYIISIYTIDDAVTTKFMKR